MKKKVMAVALAATMCAASMGLAACGGAGKGENELWITYFKGGYGSEWVEQLAKKFEQENEGVTVKTKADTLLIDATANMMKNGTNYDLIFCHDVPWEDFVQPGWIHCLDDLYESEVAPGVTFEDRIWDEDVLASSRYIGPDGQYHYYKVPWTIGTAGIAYNLTVMDRIDERLLELGETRQWNRTPPEDYYELLQYCQDVVRANITQDPDETTSPVVAPFTWSGKEEEWQWDYVVFDWWGQLAGPETMNTFKNFNQTEKDGLVNPKQADKTVYDPNKSALENNGVGWKEFKQAYELWYDLIVGHNKTNNGGVDWSLNVKNYSIGSMSKFSNENAFAYGYAAMTPAASWVEYESKTYLDDSGNEISIMPTPTISDVVLDANGKVLPKGSTQPAGGKTLDAIQGTKDAEKTVTLKNGKTYNRVSFTSSFGDSVMIPEKSSGKDLAVEFIKFMQKEENAQLFTKLSGGTILPYKYNYEDSFKDASGQDHASAWQKAIFEIDRNSTKFNNYTQNLMMRGTGLRDVARMTAMWPENAYYYLRAYNGETAFPGVSAKCDPDSLFNYIYNDIIVNHWSSYLRAL